MNNANPDTVKCVICQYDLRGLPVDGKCPECGNDIAISLGDDKLADANPFWVVKLSQAATLLLIAAICSLVWEAFEAAELFLFDFKVFSSPVPPILSYVGAFREIAGFANPLFLVGLFAIAAPEAHGLTFGAPRHGRWDWCRATRWIIALCAFGEFAVNFLGRQGSMPQLLGTLTMQLIWLALIVGQYQILRGLARRLGDSTLYRQIPIVMFARFLLWGLQYVLRSVYMLGSATDPISRNPEAYRLVKLLWLLSSAYLLALLIRYWRLLHEAAETAAERWLNHPIIDRPLIASVS
jgi:hypothetical protein